MCRDYTPSKLQDEGCPMKYIYFALASFFTLLGGCSIHFYAFEENKVTIYLKKPQAQTVLFACSLDGFAGQMLKQHDGLWEVSLPTDNSFRYFYMVDGEIFIPSCRLTENNDFGSKNCIFEPKL